MKSIVLLLLVCISCITAEIWFGDDFSHTDGRPGCQTNLEVSIKWRNNFDNVRYWVCPAVGASAVSYICPEEYLFNYERQCCIRWNFWVWTPPFDPPSTA